MVKRWIWIISLTIFLSLFSGCQESPPQPVGHAVTQIEVTCHLPGKTLKRIYTREDKMRAVLTYLRLLEPGGYASVDPQTMRTESSLITVTLSDGSFHTYRQAGTFFLQKDQKPWQRIRGISPHRLYLLVHAIEADKS